MACHGEESGSGPDDILTIEEGLASGEWIPERETKACGAAKGLSAAKDTLCEWDSREAPMTYDDGGP